MKNLGKIVLYCTLIFCGIFGLTGMAILSSVSHLDDGAIVLSYGCGVMFLVGIVLSIIEIVKRKE